MGNVKQIEDFARKRFHENDMDWFVKMHLEYVKKLGIRLAEMKGADKDIIELGVWLHDINHKKNDVSPLHHIENAEFTVKLLTEKDFDKDTIKAVEHCILTHRCKDDHRPQTLEAKILASADAMSHIENFSVLLFVAFVLKKHDTKQAYEWLGKKIDRDWNSKILISEGKDIIREKYEEVMEVLRQMKENH